MIRTQELVPDPSYNPALPVNWSGKPGIPWNQPNMWEYKDADRALRVGDMVQFTCNGRGRGGHYTVTAKVTKVNRKTFKATEWNRSYAPGTSWTVSLDRESPVYILLSFKE